MLLKFTFTLFFLFTAFAVEEYQTTNCRDGQDSPPNPKRPSIPMPRPGPGKPLVVNISAEIIAVSLDEESQEFEATFFFRQEWKDPRLAFESKDKEEFRLIINPASIWTPDLFFVNDLSNKTDNNGKDSIYVKNFPDGRVFTVERKTVKTYCLVNLLIYPFDKQTCQLQVESYGYTIGDIILQWNETENEPAVTKKLLSHDFVTSVKTAFGITSLRGAKYSSSRMIFSLSRTAITVVSRVILPMVVITISSWISFLFCKAELAARITLCISPILTYSLQIYFCTAFFVTPLYLTSLDVWAATSLAATAIAGAECIYVVCTKKPQDDCFQRLFQISDFKYRITLAIFVAGLDTLSITCILLTRHE